jgi:SAM-dependent methyltransferase
MIGSAASASADAVRFDPFFGVIDRRNGWVPPLRYLLRRQRILSIIDAIAAGELLEIGCGAGALLVDLARRGFVCTGLETSARAAQTAEAIAASSGMRYLIVQEARPEWSGSFDIVCAFDVLEHIEGDDRALRLWCDWIKPGGHLLLSVPAHSRRWGPGDVWAGHYRRYDRKPLLRLLTSQGLHIDRVESYGFPLANFTEWAGRRTYARLLSARASTTKPEVASAESGIQRNAYMGLFRWIESVPGRLALRLSYLLQRLTRNVDIGSGYLVLATKP